MHMDIGPNQRLSRAFFVWMSPENGVKIDEVDFPSIILLSKLDETVHNLGFIDAALRSVMVDK